MANALLNKGAVTMKMSGIIFSNIYDTTMGELTRHRTVASMPFGGRYRFIDFVLSNMVNSNISSIGVITKYNYQSLMDHLGGGAEWDLNRKDANLYILPPFATGVTNVYRGNLEALFNAISFLNATKPDYVVMCDTTVICNIDFNDALRSHIESGAEVTAICNSGIESYECDSNDLVLTEKKGIVDDLAIGYMLGEKSKIGMGMFIIERKTLLNIINNYVSRGRYSFEKDYLMTRFTNDSIKINAYEFKGTVLRNHNSISYFRNSFKLMEPEIRNNIFKTDAIIRTKVRDQAPTFYHSNCTVNKCLIADGCEIYGKVENSILFRGVTIAKDATVKNSIVMQGTTVGSGASLNYAIIDKDVTVSQGASLTGASSAPIIIHKGQVI